MAINTRGASYAYAGKGLQTLSAKEMARLDASIAPRMEQHVDFCAAKGISPAGAFVWEWQADVIATVDEWGFKETILDEYMRGEAYSPVRLRHLDSGATAIVGTWTATHCFGIMESEIIAARQRVLCEDAHAVHGNLKAGDAGYEKNPDNAFGEGVDGYSTETVAAYTGNAEDGPKEGAAYAAAWRARVRTKGAKDETANRKAVRENIIKTAKTPDVARTLLRAQEARWEAEDNRK